MTAAVLDQGALRSEKQVYDFGVAEQMRIGDCSYTMIPVEIRYDDADDDVDVLHYLPELGISYFAGGLENGKGDLAVAEGISITP
ncbi:hypothetical protein [Marimonas arenosa]|uniref:Uncharacterized protein n=1 Tax=Marimonas arenosa TaxID=1795305 RepID=A0AAE3WDN5_9RHOB|nr:hypothetical protein [Marimonas arenosa]MDQ2091321.1 hypothetical protein [Marimonas arenosa]